MRIPTLAALAGTIMSTTLLAADPQRKVPYTLAKDTTGITGPLHPDGSPDYLAALNILHKNVTPETNAYVDFLQIVGTESGQFQPVTHDQTLKLLGMKPTPIDAEVCQSYADFIKPMLGEDPEGIHLIPYKKLRQAPWKAEQLPLAADYLKKEGRLLDQLVEATKKPHWWMPAVSPPDENHLLNMQIPSLGSIRTTGEALAARALLRAGSGDFNACLSDIAALRRLSVHVAQGHTLVDHLVGVALESLASNASGAVIAYGSLSPDECDKMRAMLRERAPFPPSRDSMNTWEIWIQLEMVERLSQNGLNVFGGDENNLLHMIEPGEVDWDIVLRRVNKSWQEVLATADIESITEMRQKQNTQGNAIEKAAAKSGEGIAWIAAKRRAAETRQEYSERVANLFLGMFSPSLGKASELARRAQFEDEMVDVLLAAAEFRAKNGHWPENLNLLVPGNLKAVPSDPYGGAPVKYVLTPQGPRTYSICENLRDDGGYHRGQGSGKFDDDGVGVEITETKPPATP